MKKLLLIVFLLCLAVTSFSQQFSLLNTGTLYDSFENPSARAFLSDTSKMYAFNFMVPNFNADLFLSGDAQASLKSRVFLNQYDNSALKINQQKFNRATSNINVYILMFKMFTSVNGDEEMGFSWQLKTDGKASFSDESIAALNGPGDFVSGQNYTNILDSRYYYQTYHQFSFTYRERLNKQVAIGFKFSLLAGVEYQQLNINSSNATFNSAADTARANLQGTYKAAYIPGQFTAHDYLPTFRSPGASISVGSTYTTEDKFILQGNIKDLGFIHWSPLSKIYDFDDAATFPGLSSPNREDTIYKYVSKIIHNGGTEGSFTTPLDGTAELSLHKVFYIDDDQLFSYAPTLVASKELFYNGFVGALVNPIQYKYYSLTLTPSYNDLKEFNFGAQFMYRKPNWEIYIGSDRLGQTLSLTSESLSKHSTSIDQNSAYTGANIFLGFSLKLGPTIEHPMDASSIPNGEKGFLGRLWGRLFKTND